MNLYALMANSPNISIRCPSLFSSKNLLILIIFLYFTSCGQAVISENHCDVSTRYDFFKTPCVNCWQNRKVFCPRGARKVTRGPGTRGCKYEVQVGGSMQPARGCTHTCKQLITESRCCDGFWGPDCQSCPKDSTGAICGDRGQCSDGIAGNGTCLCFGNLAGSLCETCSQPQFYGVHCQSVCACVHGICDNGMDGTGSCFCNNGYGGNVCDQVLATCSSLSCHTSASCLNITGSVKCHCNKGYTGDGSTCSPINPCLTGTNTPCHSNATCVHTGPDMSSCKCKEGFSGDGVWCQAIDPCQTDNGGCDANSTVCKFDGPAKSHCECRYGFENYIPGMGCTIVDVCGKYEKTTCDPDATCETVVVGNEITVKCTCPPGAMELDRICYDDILYELTKLNGTGKYANQLNRAIGLFHATYNQLLFSPNPWTLFLPIDDAFPTLLRDNISSDAFKRLKLSARAHIVAGSININFTENSAKTMYPLLGYDYPIRALRPGEPADEGDERYFADLNFMGKLSGKILEDAKPASNGMMYIIDTLLEPSDSQSLMSSVGTVETLSKFPSLSNFTQLIMNCYTFLRRLQQFSSYAMFAPTNDAMALLGADEMSYLSRSAARASLEQLLAYSVVENPTSIFSIAHEIVIRNGIGTISVNVSLDDGSITVGNEQAKVLKSDITIFEKEIYIHIIDKVLVPQSIKPIIANRCERTSEKNVRGPCGHCGRSLCPTGGKPLDISTILVCVYKTEVQMGDGPIRIGPRMGCNRMCSVMVTTMECCAGFYGSECRSCPGPIHNACNSHGICSDSESGTGLCTCNANVTGAACDKCVNETKCGPDCALDCICKNGKCQNTISSHGECVPGSCSEGWSGENCDREIVLCANNSLHCHQFASCIVEENGNSSCVCDPGYTGSGDNCVPFNPCQSLNNGCDLHAFCLHVGGGSIACECMPNYKGDGRTCTAIDPCASEDRGLCSDFANCIFTGPGQRTCECKIGYRGDGWFCNEIDVCEENNGGCHPRAQCTKTGPATHTCQCYDGYEGDGMMCLGNLLQEIALRSDLSQLQSWISRWTMIKLLFMNLDHEFTCFLPDDSAWLSLSNDDSEFWINERHLPFLLRNHIVQSKLQSSKLKTLMGKTVQTSLQSVTLAINTVTVGTTDTNVEDKTVEQSNLPTIGKIEFAKLMVSDLPVANDGVIHIIDSVLLPPRDVVKDYPALSAFANNATGTQLEPFSKFLKLLVSTGIIDQIEEAENTPYTLFLAPDTAPNFPSSDKTEDIQKVLRYHVIMGKMIRATDISSGQHESTLLGSGYKLTLVRRHGNVLVNGQTASVSGVRSATGIIHGLSDKFLTPAETRCDGYSTQYVASTCLPCSYPNQCPGNAKLIQKNHCLFSHKTGNGAISTSVGCSFYCSRAVPQPKCCQGYYGDGCDPCPGGIDNVCFGFGTCNDGMKGNGTCVCSNPKYSGVACETCAKGLYGRMCDQECKCDKGKCNEGIDGDGTCSCFLGFRGPLCDQVANGNNSCNNTCHTAANCVPTFIGSGTKCVCSAGYNGDGKNCKAINPCEDASINSGCHSNADCVFVSPGFHNCTCKKNYEGDGKYCSPVNPCFKGFAESCDDNAYCAMIAPNVSSCVCKPTYKGDGKSCEPVNLCETDNGQCSENAICETTGPGTRKCRCKDDYFGDGVSCTGNIFTYISGRPEFEWFTLMDSFASLTPHILTRGPIIAFLPSQSLMMTLSSKLLSYEEPATQLYLNHIVGCAFTTNLTGVTRVRTLAGDILNITKTESGLKINNNISILGGPKAFANGDLYQIDSPLVPTSLTRIVNSTVDSMNMLKLLQMFSKNSSDTNPLYKNIKLLLNNNFRWVTTILENSGDLALLQNPIHNPWTLFLPTDKAFTHMPTQTLRSIMSKEDSTYAREFMRYHMVRESFVDPSAAFMNTFAEILTTLQGSDIMLNCAPGNDPLGEMRVGEATVIGFDVLHFATSSGESKAAIHIIDKVLQPPSIGGRCDIVQNVTETTKCKLCIVGRDKCPEGTSLIERRECRVPVFSPSAVTITGCQLSCASFNVTPNCCAYHYGKDCQACPGGAQNSCSRNGKCDEGLRGDGTCTCKEGFMGYACDRCLPSRYGRNCLPCRCSHYGTCDEGINGDGTCFCDSNSTGPFCEKNLTLCNPPCHKNGYCVESGTCFCKPGYRGDGINSCDFMDMCRVSNGGCSQYAICSIVQDKVVCKCLPNFIGDGYVCDGYDPCTTSNGGCHPDASCIFKSANVSRCQCNPHYQGDGIISCSRKKPSNCASNNGGCSGHALCIDVPAMKIGDYPSTNCSCKVGYVGDGTTCHGTVLSVISESIEMRNFYRMLRRQPPRLRRILSSTNEKLTVFVPAEILSSGYGRFRPAFAVTRHIVSGNVYYLQDLRKMQGILMKSGDMFPIIQTSSKNILINNVPIRKYDIIATNGVLHLIDSFITKRIIKVTTQTPPRSSTTQPRKITTKPGKSPETTKPIIPGTAIQTVQPGGTIDQDFTPKSSVLMPSSTSVGNSPSNSPSTLTSTRKSLSNRVDQLRKANGIKIGVSVLIIALIMVVVGLIYWWKYRRSGGFVPFTERQRLASDQNDDDDAFDGLTNPAYDSTGFNTADDDDVILRDADDDAAMALRGNEQPISFENPGTS